MVEKKQSQSHPTNVISPPSISFQRRCVLHQFHRPRSGNVRMKWRISPISKSLSVQSTSHLVTGKPSAVCQKQKEYVGFDGCFIFIKLSSLITFCQLSSRKPKGKLVKMSFFLGDIQGGGLIFVLFLDDFNHLSVIVCGFYNKPLVVKVSTKKKKRSSMLWSEHTDTHSQHFSLILV